MGWLDLISIGLNAAQIHQINKTRAELQNLQVGEATATIRKQLTDVLKNFVFESTKDMRVLEGHLETSPQPVYVAAKALQFRSQQFGISPAIFPEFADKEYVQRVQGDLARLVQNAQSKLSPAQLSQAEECFTAIVQMPLLNQAIEGQFVREQLQASEPEWKELAAQKGKFTNYGLLSLVGWFVVPMGMLFMYAIVDAILSNVIRDLGGLGCLVALGIMAVGAIIPIVALYFFTKQVPGYQELNKSRKEWTAKIPTKDVWSQIGSAFGEQSSEGYLDLRTQRQTLVRSLLGQVEGLDGLLATPASRGTGQESDSPVTLPESTLTPYKRMLKEKTQDLPPAPEGSRNLSTQGQTFVRGLLGQVEGVSRVLPTPASRGTGQESEFPNTLPEDTLTPYNRIVKDKTRDPSLATKDLGISEYVLKERQTRVAAGLCPKCGNPVAPTEHNCPNCKLNMSFAREHLAEW